MKDTIKITVATIAVFFLGTANGEGSSSKDWIGVTGSFKSLFTYSQTPVGDEYYWSDLNRLRLDINVQLTDKLELVSTIDNEFLVGSILETSDFRFAKTLESKNRADLDTFLLDGEDAAWRANAYRLYLKLALEKTTIIAGRQRIAWGTGRLWNPTDLFNPVSPLAVERSQREGVDALSVEHYLGSLSSIHVVATSGQTSSDNSIAIRAGTNFLGYDLGIMAGEFREAEVIGLDFAGNIGDAGFRGEATYTEPMVGKEFVRAVLSLDYTWPNSLYLLAEYLYNDGNIGGTGGLNEARERFFDGEIITQNEKFLGIGAGYELSPLVQLSGLIVYDIDDESYFLSPAINWNIRDDVDWSTGFQLFGGPGGSEYGDSANLVFSSIKFFF